MSKRRSASVWQPFASASRFIEQSRAAVLAAAVLVCLPLTVDARTVSGLARVDDFGRLLVAGETIELSGIDLPLHDRACRRTTRPVRCGPRAVMILDGLVRGFVHCTITARRAGGRLEGRCTIAGRRLFDERIDLAAELLRQGWAFARDDAPGLYRALERMARSRGLGVWTDATVDIR